MNSAETRERLLGVPTHTRGARARRCCELAKELEERGDYEGALAALGEFWGGGSEPPDVSGLGRSTTGEVLLRAGALLGWLGGSAQVEDAQASAENLIGESLSVFESLGDATKAGEALVELSYCQWRRGATTEARATLRAADGRLAPDDYELKALAALRAAVIEESATYYNDALRVLSEAAPLFEASDNHSLRGRHHNELAVVLWALATAERREDYLDRAFIEYAAAGFHFEQAGHTRYRAAVENNLGCLFLTANKFPEAHEHLDCARRLFVSLRDTTRAAQTDETRARVLLAEGRVAEAESAARTAVRALGAGGEQAILAEALTTHGAALARLRRADEARAVLRRASEVAAAAGNLEAAGLAELTLLEELGSRLSPAELRETYEAADRLLAHTQHQEVFVRLRACARLVVESAARDASDGSDDRARSIVSFVEEACALAGKSVRFAPEAVAAISRLPVGDEELRALVSRTVERAAEGETVGAGSVETLALRQQRDGADFADPWASFSFKDEVRRFEERLIEQALADARGSVSRAARLLGFRHHESLNWRLKNRNKTLLPARTPARRRRRSIIRKPD